MADAGQLGEGACREAVTELITIHAVDGVGGMTERAHPEGARAGALQQVGDAAQGADRIRILGAHDPSLPPLGRAVRVDGRAG
ncbi:hypothetical protein SDC9_142685 [bioreactor metagenome]|uniref:Uncharacterized protein n=1 Tax=bioreactor metagenome TaxID=1076179 RepID=A0A645E191_9ZZZZ